MKSWNLRVLINSERIFLSSIIWICVFKVLGFRASKPLYRVSTSGRNERRFSDGFSNLRCRMMVVGWGFGVPNLKISFSLSILQHLSYNFGYNTDLRAQP